MEQEKKKYKILIVEDHKTSALLYKEVLKKAGFLVDIVHNGVLAMSKLRLHRYDVVLTDWMMPNMDGIELVKHIRNRIYPIPIILLTTSLSSKEAHHYALSSGADEFIPKPINLKKLVLRIDELLKIDEGPRDTIKDNKISYKAPIMPSAPAVCIAASTGGPTTLIEVLSNLEVNKNVYYFMVQHGPAWMLETFSERLTSVTGNKVELAKDGEIPKKGVIYLAPGDFHLVVSDDRYKMEINQDPKENYVRPAADPLFRSIAKQFGKHSLCIILTGLGKDGSNGALHINAAGGSVIIQSPKTAIAPSMPSSAMSMDIPAEVIGLTSLPLNIENRVNEIYKIFLNDKNK